MGIFDSNRIDYSRLSANYWTNKTTSTGDGVFVQLNNNFKKGIIIVNATINSGDSANIYFTKISTGKADSEKESLKSYNITNKNIISTDTPSVPHSVINYIYTTGTYIYIVDFKNVNKFSIGCSINGTCSLTVDYIAEINELTDVEYGLLNNNTDFRYTKINNISKNYELSYLTSVANNRITAVLRNIAIKTNGSNRLFISKDYYDGVFTEVVLNATNFPNLISGSLIAHTLLLPFTRKTTAISMPDNKPQIGADWRLVVLTTKGQIYHNYPSRATNCDGTALSGDEYLFEESVIWDMEGRRYPSQTQNNTIYIKNPCLPSANYTPTPAINGVTPTIYGNLGFGESITITTSDNQVKTFPRFYLPNRDSTPFTYMGGYEPTDKISLIGTYQGNTNFADSTRIGLFATSDGGRMWFLKYEFGGTNGVDNRGVAINTSSLVDNYTENGLNFRKRTNVTPTLGAENPTNIFSFGATKTASSITKANPAVVTCVSHGLVTGDLIHFLDNGITNDSWDWMKNNTASETSKGTGLFFKVVKLTNDTFSLYECHHNVANNITARHIHSINRLKDGFTMGTGEAYPEGFIFYIKQHMSDTHSVRHAYDDMAIYRLNSTNNSLQRPLGFIIKDDADSTILFGSDNETTSRGTINIPNLGTFSRSSCGLFSGKLSDINDFSKFYPILDTSEVCYYFKEHLGAMIFIGQKGFFAISFDNGITWSKTRIPIPHIIDTSSRFLGISDRNEILIQNLLITLKK